MNYIKKIKIGNILLKNNVFLAPMAGATDIAFRRICRKYGPALTYTEMVSAKACEYGSEKTEKLFEIDKDEHPSIVQIFGHEIDVIKDMIIKLNQDSNIDIIDINMGCPAPKIVKNGDGAGLLLDLENVKKIVDIAVKNSKKPITVKTRKGFDSDKITAIDVAKICENLGVAMITIHGRTRMQYYSGQADMDIIKKVKESVNIPVIANGDICDIESANHAFEYTGCDGIMIARAALSMPWIFKSIIDQKEYVPTLKERFNIIFSHIDYMLEYTDKNQTNLKLRKNFAWYLKGLNNSSKIRDMIMKSDNLENTKLILRNYYKELIKEGLN